MGGGCGSGWISNTLRLIQENISENHLELKDGSNFEIF